MKKTMHVIGNPRLDTIFSEAYRNTMNQVALREQSKYDADYYETFSGLFEKELYNRDLTAEERGEFMATFHREVETLHRAEENRRGRRRRFFLIGGLSLIGVLVLSFAIYVATARPFMPVSKVIEQLDYNIAKVEEGYSSYTEKFYRLIDRHGKKLEAGSAVEYRFSMYEILDGHFDETIAKLEAGEIRYFDDTKKWASTFPDAEERADRKEAAENAFKKGLGSALGETLDDVKEGAKNLIGKVIDFFRDAVRGGE